MVEILADNLICVSKSFAINVTTVLDVKGEMAK